MHIDESNCTEKLQRRLWCQLMLLQSKRNRQHRLQTITYNLNRSSIIGKLRHLIFTQLEMNTQRFDIRGRDRESLRVYNRQ